MPVIVRGGCLEAIQHWFSDRSGSQFMALEPLLCSASLILLLNQTPSWPNLLSHPTGSSYLCFDHTCSAMMLFGSAFIAALLCSLSRVFICLPVSLFILLCHLTCMICFFTPLQLWGWNVLLTEAICLMLKNQQRPFKGCCSRASWTVIEWGESTVCKLRGVHSL